MELTPPQSEQSPPNAIASPPTYGVSQFAIAANPGEFLLTVGHSRAIFEPQQGVLTQKYVVEWLATFSMSPVSAKQLVDGLSKAIARYENQTGPIPTVGANAHEQP
jgi:hypothetical protein